jgi:hypothetical protein
MTRSAIERVTAYFIAMLVLDEVMRVMVQRRQGYTPTERQLPETAGPRTELQYTLVSIDEYGFASCEVIYGR